MKRSDKWTLTAASFLRRGERVYFSDHWIATRDFAVRRSQVANAQDFKTTATIVSAFPRLNLIATPFDCVAIDRNIPIMGEQRLLWRTDWLVDVGGGRRYRARMFENEHLDLDGFPRGQALVWERVARTFDLHALTCCTGPSLGLMNTGWAFGLLFDALPDPSLIISTVGSRVACTRGGMPSVPMSFSTNQSPSITRPLPIGLRARSRNVAQGLPLRAIHLEEEE